MEKLLDIRNLRTYFYTEDGVVPAVDGVSFYIKPGETLGVVGESGCGKSVTSISTLRLVPNPPGKIMEGSEIIFEGTDLLKLSEAEMRKIRGNKISMIFQEPMTSLNPVFRIGDQIAEVLLLHQGLNKAEAREKAIEMLKLVGIPRPEKVVDDYPHSLSGGMRQRVMIAMALACNPRLLIADEPTTALDVTVQAQILDLMNDLKKKVNAAVMLITHNLGVVAESCDRVVVMYAGKVVEEGDVYSIFEDPKHPYTVGLLKSMPSAVGGQDKLDSIPGVVPNPLNLPKGCRFAPRCNKAMDICREKQPGLTVLGEERTVRCFLYNREDGVK
ncbi:peptide ABC transporter ATP-binding protein [Fervidicella metallireducens AeB]|uniref:Peptide ABC transporter ATP-binding protein n=1 Tax=Fervidicella metallireducens AeB TaxID=1403537 RepID=A0A017RTX6_9CLOT|nr:ABC transporter ATP-binding protein [Fervidicella metallireducens]EYE88218.1 peptide ABC transporter ATP-binding protein [Fervidicella metallireducens AeB]